MRNRPPEYVLCYECRKKIARFNREIAAKRKRLGLQMGRPRKAVDPKVIARVRAGKLTLAAGAQLCGLSPVTLRRRMKEEDASDEAADRLRS